MKCCVEYVWTDVNGKLRGKTRVVNDDTLQLEDIPQWSYDGSSTGQAEGSYSEIILKPVKLIKDPFRRSSLNYIVLCACYNPDNTPAKGNTRDESLRVFNSKESVTEEPWYGIEQEYTLLANNTLGDVDDNIPAAWDTGKNIAPQADYYCGVGSSNIIGRELVEEHLDACLYADLTISGINAEVMPGQWEFQVGPCLGVDAGDQLLLARYILQRLSEKHGYNISYCPKPKKHWNGAGAHINFSTNSMREDINCTNINTVVERFSKMHMEHIAVYGIGNEERLTGIHETSSLTKFSAGVGNRGASIRIPIDTDKNGKGYIEDRRPASSVDPYPATAIMAKTALGL